MRLISVETTPNPNSMKLNLDESLGKAVTYTENPAPNCPAFIARLLQIYGIKSIFACENFITLNRDPRSDWQPILAEATAIFAGSNEPKSAAQPQFMAAENLGQCTVLVQTFAGIPIQIKTTQAAEEHRLALNSRFSQAAQMIQDKSGADFLKERYWADWGIRYGTPAEVSLEIKQEIDAMFDDTRLANTVAQALGKTVSAIVQVSISQLELQLASSDWQVRLRTVQELSTTDDAAPLLIEALKDADQRVRRLAAAALGASGNPSAVEPLTRALLEDSSVAVRRTAGDALSDLASIDAQPAICRALSDKNKLVRWRAARFLTDLGTPEALPYLQAATTDSEFEVRLEVQAAIERITSGKAGSQPAWMKMGTNTERD